MNNILYTGSFLLIGFGIGQHIDFSYSPYTIGLLGVLITVSSFKKVELQKIDALILLVSYVFLIFLNNIFPLIIPHIVILLFFYILARKSESSRYLERVIAENKKEASEFNKVLQSLKKERHDYLKHISAIQYLLETANTEEAKKYLNSIINKFENTNLSIRGEQGVIAAILNDRFQRAQKINIQLNYNLTIPLSQLSIQNEQLVSLIGNILDNALDAAEEYKKNTNNPTTIDLTFTKKFGIFILECANSTCPIPTTIIDNIFRKGEMTTKSNHDGLGTVIISEIVKYNNGHLDYTYYKNKFTLKIKFPAIH